MSIIASKFQKDINAKILVIGDVMIDHYIYGNCNRISPEAPVPVLEISSNSYMLGGAANLAKNITSLGVDCDIISVVGDDDNGKKIKNMLNKEGFKSDTLFFESKRKTTCKKRIIASSQQLLRIDEESQHLINEDSENQIINYLQKNIFKYNLVLISDYLKGVITHKLSKEVIELSNKNNIKVLVDPKGKDFSKYANAFLIKPNISELEVYTGIKLVSYENILSASINLRKNLNLACVITTMGEKGILLIEEDSQENIKTFCQQVYDVSGAGDTVLATISVCLLKEITLINSCVFANSAASIVISKFGSNVPSINEIILNINKHEKHFNFRN